MYSSLKEKSIDQNVNFKGFVLTLSTPYEMLEGINENYQWNFIKEVIYQNCDRKESHCVNEIIDCVISIEKECLSMTKI